MLCVIAVLAHIAPGTLATPDRRRTTRRTAGKDDAAGKKADEEGHDPTENLDDDADRQCRAILTGITITPYHDESAPCRVCDGVAQ